MKKMYCKTVIYRVSDFESVPKPSNCSECTLHYQGCKDTFPLIVKNLDCRATNCNILGIRYQFMFNF